MHAGWRVGARPAAVYMYYVPPVLGAHAHARAQVLGLACHYLDQQLLVTRNLGL